MSGPHFRDYHLLFDEQADQIFAATDVIAERVRKIGAPTLRSIGDISRHQRIADNDAPYVDPDDMLAELRDDNQRFITALREAHDVCEEHGDVATASLLEVFIDEAERRVWFLYEAGSQRRPNRALISERHDTPGTGRRGMRPLRTRHLAIPKRICSIVAHRHMISTDLTSAVNYGSWT